MGKLEKKAMPSSYSANVANDVSNAMGGPAADADQVTAPDNKREPASEEERAQRMAQLKTQGVKGCKATRINMAFTPDNHKFLKVMAKATGCSMTEVCNAFIEQFRNEHPEIMAKVQAVLDETEGLL